eukprot:gene8008-1237_t
MHISYKINRFAECRIAPEGGQAVEASTANDAFARLWVGADASSKGKAVQRPGLEIFGLMHPKVMRHVLALPNSNRCDRFCYWPGGEKPYALPLSPEEELQRLLLCARLQKLPPGIVPQGLSKPLLSECDETEHEGSLMLQCDNCRMCVHMDCYGQSHEPDGSLWLCDMCELYSCGLKEPPCCILCPVIGGAMKRTTDGRWCHLVCAMWIPEMGFDDPDRLEPIDGGRMVSSARRQLLCKGCKQPYGHSRKDTEPGASGQANGRAKGQTEGLANGQATQKAQSKPRRKGLSFFAEGTKAGSARLLCFCPKHSRMADANTQYTHRFKSLRPPPAATTPAKPPPVPRGSSKSSAGQGQAHPVAGSYKSSAGQGQEHPGPGSFKSSTGQGQSHPGQGRAHAGSGSSKNSAELPPPRGVSAPRPPSVQSWQHPNVLRPLLTNSSSLDFPVSPALALSKDLRSGNEKQQITSMQGTVPSTRLCPAPAPLDTARPLPSTSSQAHPGAADTQAPAGYCRVELTNTGQNASTAEAEAAGAPMSLLSHLWPPDRPVPPNIAHAHGSARCAPQPSRRSRGLREPDTLSKSEAKRLYVRKTPYLVNGCVGMPFLPMPPLAYRTGGPEFESNGHAQEQPPGVQQAGVYIHGRRIKSMAERYQEMMCTVPNRLTSGKSAIHGIGAFAKVDFAAGDMVIEYVGDLIRPTVADVRERTSYDNLVGAGTYIFRLNYHMCVDATRSGNMAHLLNHSCAPNCHSRTISVRNSSTGVVEDHVVIFAKTHISASDELTYDYRFNGDEKLPCNCGVASCRGLVNVDMDNHDDGSSGVVGPDGMAIYLDASGLPIGLVVHRSQIVPVTPDRSSDCMMDDLAVSA